MNIEQLKKQTADAHQEWHKAKRKHAEAVTAAGDAGKEADAAQVAFRELNAQLTAAYDAEPSTPSEIRT